MLYPSIDKLLEKMDSKYSLVVAASKRARQLREGVAPEIGKPVSHKMVGIALEEMYKDYIRFEKIPNSNKEGTK
ncbi:DNA-directed RNA polymerase subunit omega [Gorillibacterium massiliense]|uniref:DNA-directed RNA polymerase subunit omega n=1 Tax=Gorillibacterium massiliense TaxID=1280390 RepID=UPI0004B4B2C0|nr:DNA-directed RNA polymerase subunit omega [Gorillibacterium massiliense]